MEALGKGSVAPEHVSHDTCAGRVDNLASPPCQASNILQGTSHGISGGGLNVNLDPTKTTALTLALLAALAALAPADTTGAATSELRRRLQDELQSGQLDSALTTARALSASLPDNQGLWYNLAGLEQSHGRPDAAVDAFDRAVALGFDDFRHADQDSNLGDLRRHPRYQDHRARWRQTLAAEAAAKSTSLVIGQWSAPIVMNPRQPADDTPSASFRLRAGQHALEVELTVEGHGMTPHPPWRGGSGVFVSVHLPEVDQPAEGRHFVEVAVGQADGAPVGAVRLGQRWQRIAELTPKLIPDQDGATLLIVFSVPWTLAGSLHPLVDTTLGLNLAYVRGAGAAPAVRLAWLDDPAAGRADRRWRRGVPIRWQWPAAEGPAVRGRLSDLVVRDDTLTFDPLVVVATDARPAAIELVLRDRAQRVAKRASWTVDGPPGRRQRPQTLSLAGVDRGPVRLGLSWHDPATDAVGVWDADLLLLPASWEAETAARIAAAPGAERPSLRHRLDAIEQALQTRHPLDNPGPIGTTVDELETMLDHLASFGTTLVAGAPYLAVMNAEEGRPELRCSLFLPEDWRPGRTQRTLVVLAVATGGEQRVVNLVPRFLAEHGADHEPVLVAVPHLGELLPATAGPELIARLLDWLVDLVDAGPFYLAGTDLHAATVIELAATGRPDLAGILMLTGMNFRPYPDEGASEMAVRVAGVDPGLAAGWLWFPEEQGRGDQARALRRALRSAGLTLNPAQAVQGGLDLTQAWTRALLWTLKQERR